MEQVTTVSDLRTLIQSRFSPAYKNKMLHTVPEWPVVKERGTYLAEKAKDKVVLDIGCTGPLSEGIRTAAKTYYGVDREAGNWAVVDLDKDPTLLPFYEDVDLVIASEVLEHLANPGRFLEALAKKYPDIPTYFTVPNAGAYSVYEGCEMVNKDHVAWYSYTTLQTLLMRYGYKLQLCRWYNGHPHKAEGLIVLAKV